MEVKRVVWVLGVLIFVLFASVSVHAKSVYVIAEMVSGKIHSYWIDEEELIYQIEADFDENSAIGIAADHSPEGTYLFVTYEEEDFIKIINAQSMQKIKDIALPQASNLAGIVYDPERKKVYTVDRFTNHLYSYSWNARKLTLEADFTNPYYIELTEVVHNGTSIGAIGLAFDLSTDCLYVSDRTGVIKEYNVGDWSYRGEIETSLEKVIGIAVDSDRQKLYFASMEEYGEEWHYLGIYDLAASNPNYAETAVYTGASVSGITVDPDTGCVFITLYSFDDPPFPPSAPEDSVQMFCPDAGSLSLVWDSEDIGNPAGIVFAMADTKPSGLYIDKKDDTETCVYPDEMITYTIGVHPLYRDEPNVVVTDILPFEVEFVSADPAGTYDSDTHVYVWEPGDLPWIDPGLGDPNTYLTLTVQVNEGAEPNGILVNRVAAESDFSYNAAEEETAVCCWGGNVIYVDQDAAWQRISFYEMTGARGYNNGTSWENAYRDLNDALTRADKGCGSEIWAAEGTYYPGSSPEDSFFEIPAEVSVYGGFAGIETERAQRNWNQHNTTLRGYIGPDAYGNPIRNETVVEMKDGAVLDGFTVTEASDYGIYGDGADFTVENCTIKKNEEYGIYALDSNVIVKWCDINHNERHGIRHEGLGTTITVENSQINKNKQYGLYTLNSTPIIKNNVFLMNGISQSGFQGIAILLPFDIPMLFNNTIVLNQSHGVLFTDDQDNTGNPNNKDWPDIQNCILWYNNEGGHQVLGFEPDHTAYYCCIQDCNDVNSNIDDEPAFAYSDPNNLHLAWDSPCLNKGNPTHTTEDVGLYDMDSEDRIVDNRVDIGADEIYSCDDDLSEDDIRHPLDWDSDGIINYIQFGDFSRAWLSHNPNEPGLGDPNLAESWNPLYNLDATGDSQYIIDLDDLDAFCEDDPQVWLWAACWKRSQMDHPETMFYSMLGGGDGMISIQMAESDESSSIMDTNPSPVEEKSIEQQILDLEEIIEFLETIWLDESDIQEVIDPQDWQDFMEAVNQSLIELQTGEVQIE